MLLRLAMFALVLASGGWLSAAEPAPNTLTEQELAEGWIALFDGESLYGWKEASEANWKVEGGEIRASEGEPGLLHTTTQFADYVLRVDFRAAPETNSGVFLRTSPRPAGPTDGCYEVNIAGGGENEFPTGSLVERAKSKTGALDNEWHTLEIHAQGPAFRILLDGELAVEYRDESETPLGRGFIGLQYNGDPIAFRNIRLKPLGLAPLFNGRDLSGWKVYDDPEDNRDKTEFSVTDRGELHLKDGPGQLETERQFADYVLRTEVYVNGKELNSGIFFRSIPGDYQNGYEAQIHNGTIDGDRNKPNNGGTGGIFRRQEARRVVSNDFEWFPMTIVAEGNHMAVWVGGIQVSDWTDRREPDENPRRGLRTEAGTIILQGHDPTTDLLFRKIEAGEMPTRR